MPLPFLDPYQFPAQRLYAFLGPMAFNISAHMLRYSLNQQSLFSDERPLVAFRHFFQIEYLYESNLLVD